MFSRLLLDPPDPSELCWEYLHLYSHMSSFLGDKNHYIFLFFPSSLSVSEAGFQIWADLIPDLSRAYESLSDILRLCARIPGSRLSARILCGASGCQIVSGGAAQL